MGHPRIFHEYTNVESQALLTQDTDLNLNLNIQPTAMLGGVMKLQSDQTVAVPVCKTWAISPSLLPSSASRRIWARLSLRAECSPLLMNFRK